MSAARSRDTPGPGHASGGRHRRATISNRTRDVRLAAAATARRLTWIALGLCLSVAVLFPLSPAHGQSDPATTDTENPSSLTGAIASTGVALSWTAPTLETDTLTGYEVARRRVLNYATSWVTIVEDTDSLGTSYTDASADVNGAEYEYRVHALRGEGDDQERSAASNVITVTIPNPPRPQDLTATSTTSGVQLSWSAGHLSWQSVSLSLNGYEIRRIESRHAGNRNPEWEVLVDNTNSANTSYLDASGYTTIQYSYAIRAVHGFLRSYWEGIAGPVAGQLDPDDAE